MKLLFCIAIVILIVWYLLWRLQVQENELYEASKNLKPEAGQTWLDYQGDYCFIRDVNTAGVFYRREDDSVDRFETHETWERRKQDQKRFLIDPPRRNSP